jgi:hypothetical protein
MAPSNYTLEQQLDAFYSLLRFEDNGCWIWDGALSTTKYGQFHFRGKTTFAHRVSWMLHRGEIPHGMSVCVTPVIPPDA